MGNKSSAGWAVAALLSLAVLTIVGCNGPTYIGGGGNGGGGGNADVQLGTMRQYTGGEAWNYNLTGTFVLAGGGTTAITPAQAQLTYSANDVVVGAVTGCHLLTLTVPVTIGAESHTETFVVALKQEADGTLRLVGFDPNAGAVSALASPIDGPAAGAFATTANWGGTRASDMYGEFQINCTNNGTENVVAGGHTYVCHKVTGTKVVGGFQSNFTIWINPQLGAFPRMACSYTDVLGTTTLQYDLRDFNFAL